MREEVGERCNDSRETCHHAWTPYAVPKTSKQASRPHWSHSLSVKQDEDGLEIEEDSFGAGYEV